MSAKLIYHRLRQKKEIEYPTVEDALKRAYGGEMEGAMSAKKVIGSDGNAVYDSERDGNIFEFYDKWGK